MNVIGLFLVLTLFLPSSDALHLKTRGSEDQQALSCKNNALFCPENTKCDMSSGKCVRKTGMTVVLMEKIEANPISVKTVNLCSDGVTRCESGQTCCKLKSQRYGCCPLANTDMDAIVLNLLSINQTHVFNDDMFRLRAVCCPDGNYCCPNGTKCASGKCRK